MSKDEIKEAVKEAIAEYKNHRPPAMCCGGLTLDESEQVKDWTKGGGFSDPQMDALKGFGNALISTKKYIAIGIGIVAIITLRDFWMDLLRWLKEHLIR